MSLKVSTNRYIAFDVELANREKSSICKIGLVVFEDGEEVANETYLLNPNVKFLPRFVKKHGITSKMVENAPSFEDIHFELSAILHNEQIVVHHNHLDPHAIKEACEKYNLAPIEPIWIDTLKIANKMWGKGENSLPKLAEKLNIPLNHHDPLDDARVCGLLFKHQLLTGRYSSQKLYEIGQFGAKKESYRLPSTPIQYPKKIKLKGNPKGKYTGTVVFSENNYSREALSNLAAKAGFNVDSLVTMRTTHLVVGNLSINTGKMRKAKDYNKRKKLGIKIMLDDDFMEMLIN